MGIVTDPISSRTTDPDRALNSSFGPESSKALVAVQATQIVLTLMASWPMETNKVSGV